MEGSCRDCKHWDIGTDREPCKSCRGCWNCKSAKAEDRILFFDMPECQKCARRGFPSRWEPKEDLDG
jgi:hypothetical protein